MTGGYVVVISQQKHHNSCYYYILYQLTREEKPEYKIHLTLPDPYQDEAYRWTHGWRDVMAGWIFETVDHHDIPRVVAVVALNYFDRYMSSAYRTLGDTELTRKQHFKLVCVGAIYLANKSHGAYRKMFFPQYFKRVSRGQFSVTEIEEMELKLLDKLRATLNPPLPIYFAFAYVRAILNIIPSGQQALPFRFLEDMSYELSFLTELCAVSSNPFITQLFPASVIAYACVRESLRALEHDAHLPIMLVMLRYMVVNKKHWIVPNATMKELEDAQAVVRDIHEQWKERDGEEISGDTSTGQTPFVDSSGRVAPLNLPRTDQAPLWNGNSSGTVAPLNLKRTDQAQLWNGNAPLVDSCGRVAPLNLPGADPAPLWNSNAPLVDSSEGKEANENDLPYQWRKEDKHVIPGDEKKTLVDCSERKKLSPFKLPRWSTMVRWVAFLLFLAIFFFWYQGVVVVVVVVIVDSRSSK